MHVPEGFFKFTVGVGFNNNNNNNSNKGRVDSILKIFGGLNALEEWKELLL
jgi:hypothetical protein